jgi:predicted DNA-binding transcriptional regulator AlpA
MSQSPYYSVDELSEVLRVCQKWVYQQLSKGNIPGAFRIGNSPWFIDKEIFHETLKKKAQSPKRENAGNNRHNL